jgi:hypothetical protein
MGNWQDFRTVVRAMRPTLKYMPLLLALITGSFISCKHEPLATEDVPVDDGGNGQEPEPIDTCDPNVAYFQQEVLPIFIQTCTTPGCHNLPTDENDEIQLTDYATITNPDYFDEIWEAINEDDMDRIMPPDSMNPLTPDQINTIGSWLQQGAQNNSCESGCDTSAVTYGGTIFPIIQARCLNCHSGTDPDGGLNFGSWADLNSVALDGRLAGAIQHQATFSAMPPSGPMLNQCRIDKFLTWIQDGAPNN